MIRTDFSVIWQHMPALLEGLKWTIIMVSGGLAFGIVLGLLACFGKILRRGPLYWLSVSFIEIFRTLPEMVVVFWIYFCLPLLFNARMPAVLCGLIALSLFSGAILAEIFRGGFEAVPRGQVEAALALGIGRPAIWWNIVLPQALRMMTPAFILFLTDLIKVSGLLSAISVGELVYQAAIVSGTSFRHFEMFSAVAVFYFMLIFPLSMAGHAMERRLARRAR